MTGSRHDDQATDRVDIQRRTLNTARLAVVPAGAAIASVATVHPLLAKELLGSDRFAGSAGAVFTLGAAFASVPLATYMRRRGRRVGLVVALVVAAGGVALAAVAAEFGWFWAFLAGMLVFGAGQAANLQARYVVVDLAPEVDRAAAIGAVVWVGALGAVVGPVVVPQVERLGDRLGLSTYVSPFVLAACLMMISALIYQARLRPDPLVVAGGLDPHAGRQRPLARAWAGVAVIAPRSRAVLGVAAMAISQAVMVGVMTMTPPYMRDHGDGGLAAYVIAVHIFGMYGLAPLVGRVVDRVGQSRSIQYGAVVLGGGCVLSVAGGYSRPLVFVGLFLLGLGWNVALIAGTSLLTAAVPESSRVEAQGAGDLLLSLSSAIAAIASGLIKVGAGFGALVAVASIAAAVLVAWATVHRVRGPRGATT